MSTKKAAIIDDLKAYKQAFDRAKIPWVIIGGVVLGYARYGDVMDWDTDSDVAVFSDLSNAQWHTLWVALRNNGFNFPSNRVDFMYCFRRTECNLEFYHKDGNFYNCFPASTPGIKFVESAKWFDDIQLVDFLGDKYPMPNHIEDFVAAHYGSDWKTNIIKNHEEYFTEKRGGRDQALWTTSRASKNGDLWPKALKINDSLES